MPSTGPDGGEPPVVERVRQPECSDRQIKPAATIRYLTVFFIGAPDGFRDSHPRVLARPCRSNVLTEALADCKEEYQSLCPVYEWVRSISLHNLLRNLPREVFEKRQISSIWLRTEGTHRTQRSAR